VFFTEAARTDLKRYPHLAARFESRIQTLAARPDRGHLLSEALAGTRSLELTRQRGGFRAIYRWNREPNYVLVFALGPHATVYQTATERYPPPEPSAGG
jgi:mRNA-degrading endonuclease RelE of RelBE toxin-antitoxin system